MKKSELSVVMTMRCLLSAVSFVWVSACGVEEKDEQQDTEYETESDGNTDGDTDTGEGSDSNADSDSEADAEVDTNVSDVANVDTDTIETCDTDCPELEWIPLAGGAFEMGDPANRYWDYDEGENNEPVHEVTVPDFEMLKTEVTVAQYRKCVEASVCKEPSTTGYDNWCSTGPRDNNWIVVGRENHPINCVSWAQAVVFCVWVGGRLPSEAEWEYAARSRGKLDTGDEGYPWGGDLDDECEEYCIHDDGCGTGHTWEVCSAPAGNTQQGLCDMAGNIVEWVQDWWHDNYEGAPTDGSAWVVLHVHERVTRGGFYGGECEEIWDRFGAKYTYPGSGIRCVR